MNIIKVIFDVPDDLKLIIKEHVHYRKNLTDNFNKKELKLMTFANVNVWLHEKNMFPLISKLVKLVCMIPSSTAACERNFSGMRFIKN